MIPLFNVEIGTRIADLQAAAARGDTLSVTFEPALGRQPDRINVTIAEAGRVLVFAIPTARTVAAQFRANGFVDLADTLEHACGPA